MLIVNETLLAQVKRKFNITWEDDDTNARLEEIIASAIPKLIFKLGISDANFDFSVAGMENDLFKSYCLYEWNHVANEFDDNYSNEIAQIQAKHLVKYHQDNEVSENEEE